MIAVKFAGTARLELDAYVHQWDGVVAARRGTAWMQPVQLEITSPVVAKSLRTIPADLSTGRVVAAGLPEGDDGMLTVPVVLEGTVTLEVETNSGEIFRVTGTRLEVTTLGDARFVEDIPGDMDPEHGSI